jgi:hypothetical protein
MPSNFASGAVALSSPATSQHPFAPALYAWIVVLICGAIFVDRGPMRAADPAVNMDAPLLLAAATAWRRGGDPYDPVSVARALGENASLASKTLERGRQAFVYPPPVYALLAPITYLPWAAQRWAWNLLNIAMYLTSLALICGIVRAPLRSAAGVAILGIGLATDPAHICIALGQTGVAVLFLMSVSWFLAPGGVEPTTRYRFAVAALAMGAAAIIKPQIALIFMICDYFTGRRTVAAGAVAAASVLFVGALAIHGDALAQTQSWIANMHALMHGDADPLNSPLPHQMINLQSPLAVLTGSRELSTALALAACALLGIVYAWIDRHMQASTEEDPRMVWLNALSAASILMLLIFYHRLYDAVFLMIPGAFAIRQIVVRQWRGWALLALLVPVWYPLSSALYRALGLSGSFDVTTAVQILLVQHQTWFLVAAFLLVCEIRRRHSNGSRAYRAFAPQPLI